MTRKEVLEQYKQECNFLMYGSCRTFGCLARGGYERGCNPDKYTPTCAAKEAVEAAGELNRLKRTVECQEQAYLAQHEHWGKCLVAERAHLEEERQKNADASKKLESPGIDWGPDMPSGY